MQGFYWADIERQVCFSPKKGPGRNSTREHAHASYLTIHHSVADTAVALHNIAACCLSITKRFDFLSRAYCR